MRLDQRHVDIHFQTPITVTNKRRRVNYLHVLPHWTDPVFESCNRVEMRRYTPVHGVHQGLERLRVRL